MQKLEDQLESRSMANLQKDANQTHYKKLLTDRNKKLDELEQTHINLQKHIPNMAQKPDKPRVAVAFSLLEDLIDECIYDVLFDVHKDIKKQNSICQICQSKCRCYVRKPGVDIWGNSYTVQNLPTYECVNCKKSIASSRYAPHLEKCLGLAGSRTSSRVASRRLNNMHNNNNSPSLSSVASSVDTVAADSPSGSSTTTASFYENEFGQQQQIHSPSLSQQQKKRKQLQNGSSILYVSLQYENVKNNVSLALRWQFIHR
ncbi:hypothetical protein BDF20DRAFT_989364 [Mycotypha africana]|uniref:uncharacterized protein n=1 Tax=Mycotypha africana TaxID=64632 RepID=UPI00230025F1|nr:uncharacterized protein BDF20DRAFT_989364 [Mycotypha africana]KAI8973373.1 hypothetical protein BDF20DRAFT_989364 [Mycotypha africana]